IKRKLEDEQIGSTYCPYCVEPNLGVVYYPPSITTGAARLNYMKHRPQLSSQLSQNSSISSSKTDSSPRRLGPRSLTDNAATRARSHSVNNSREPTIVMSDDIRPFLLRDLNAKLEKKKREQARQAANLASVALVTQRMSARNQARANRTNGEADSNTSGNRDRLFGRRVSGTRSRQSEYNSYVTAMRAAGQTDLEEFLVQEAIRMSLAEQGSNSRENTNGPSSEPASSADADADADADAGDSADVQQSIVEDVIPEEGNEAEHQQEQEQEQGQQTPRIRVGEVDENTMEDVRPPDSPAQESSQATLASAQDSTAEIAEAPSSPSADDPLLFDATELDAIARASSRRRKPPAPPTKLQVDTCTDASGSQHDTMEDIVSIAVEQAKLSPTGNHRRQNTNPFINAAVMSNDDATRLDFPALQPQPLTTPSSPVSLPSAPPGSRRRPPPPPPPTAAPASMPGRSRSASHPHSDKTAASVSTAGVSQQQQQQQTGTSPSPNPSTNTPALIFL
ncbi:SNF1-interacting protein, partial [Dipsacomyces acuminosporus]